MILPQRRYSRWLAAVSVCVVLPGVACRDTDPPPTHYGDLGTDGTLLLPVSAPPYAISKVTDAQAEWHPVTDPAERESAPSDDEVEDDASTAETEAEIRELIEQYNEVAAEGDVEGMLEYYMPEQQEAFETLLETSLTIAEKVTGLGDALKEKLPDADERISAALAGVGSQSGSVFVAESLTVVSDTEVTAKLPPGAWNPTCRFVVSDEEWFIDISGLDAGKTKSELDAALERLSGWLGSVSSGDVLAEEVLAQIEAAGAEAEATGSSETD